MSAGEKKNAKDVYSFLTFFNTIESPSHQLEFSITLFKPHQSKASIQKGNNSTVRAWLISLLILKLERLGVFFVLQH